MLQKIIQALFQFFSLRPRSTLRTRGVALPDSETPDPGLAPGPTPPPEDLGYTVPWITATQLKEIIPTLSSVKCIAYLSHLIQTCDEFGIETPLQRAAFIAQTAHESIGYSAFAENLNYSAPALIATWPTRFTPEDATLFARQPEMIANHVYCNRLGNNTEESGDGWRYRGRGVIQTTGLSNYRACGTALGLDLVASPELLEQPLEAFRSAGWYWKSRNCNSFADSGDFVGLTRAINGGILGLADREAYYTRAKTALGI